ncbi:MAG: dihydrolipoamide acetyltransferase family protein [Solirubrobacteraceae bacterium]
MPKITMPRLSDSMEEGTIVRWLKSDGETVKRDEELVEIETDKATVTYEADASGVLTIVLREGETAPVGAVIGELAGPSAAASGAGTNAGAGATVQAGTAASDPAESGPSAGGSLGSGSPIATTSAPPSGDEARPSGTNGHVPAQKAKASPLARRIAGRLGVDVAAIGGTGPLGRVLKRDVIAHAEGRREAGAQAPQGDGAAAPATAASVPATAASVPATAASVPAIAAAAGGSDGGETARGRASVEQLTRTQATIARRMSESRATVPAFCLEVDVDMTATLAARATFRKLAEPTPSLNDIIVKACALALRAHPRANGSYRDGEFQLHGRVNVGIAVAAQDALVVPTIADADIRSLGQIARESRRLIAAARERTLTPAELAGATFTISNLGMYGIDRFEGIINPPQAAILCVGAVVERPVVRDGAIVARSTMSAALACDHRILYGADAAELLADIRQALEEPLALAL